MTELKARTGDGEGKTVSGVFQLLKMDPTWKVREMTESRMILGRDQAEERWGSQERDAELALHGAQQEASGRPLESKH